MSPTATYDGTPITAMIADRTNPWVEVDGVPYDWATDTHPSDPTIEPGCTCFGSPIAGTIPAMDTDHGIQRCDECGVFEGDLEAALALAALVGGIVRFEVETDTDTTTTGTPGDIPAGTN